MSLKLNAPGGGSVTLQEPTTASNVTLNLPAANGTVQLLGESLNRGTAVTASGTSVDFTGIPSWAKRITVMFNNVSTNGTSNVQIQLGSGSPATSGYQASSIASTAAGNSASLATTGFVLLTGAATALLSGSATFSNLTGNFWSGSLTFGQSDSARVACCYGTINLAGALDRLRITTVNGTDTFDAGTINIMWEG